MLVRRRLGTIGTIRIVTGDGVDDDQRLIAQVDDHRALHDRRLVAIG